MKIAIVLALCVVAALGAPSMVVPMSARRLPALQHEEVHDEFGQFALRYVTAEGTTVYQRARMDPSGSSLLFEGEYSYIGEDGKTYRTRYTTDNDGGYHLIEDHVPVTPEVRMIPVFAI